jgi:hypothetical protein
VLFQKRIGTAIVASNAQYAVKRPTQSKTIAKLPGMLQSEFARSALTY